MFKSMSNWLESVGMVERPSTPPADVGPDSQKDSSGSEIVNSNDAIHNSDEHSTEQQGSSKEQENDGPVEQLEDPIDAAIKKIDDVGEKAVSTALEWGSYLYGFGKSAGQTVLEKAKESASILKNTMEDKTLIGEFSKEQEKFIAVKREKRNKAEAAVPPWVGYNEENEMKLQILALSNDRRNFLRNPPSGAQFQFEFAATHPVAMTMLQEDPDLQKMRFELVPKQIREEEFWRNYFYRVSLIKQSTQLTSLAQETGSEKSGSSSRRSSTDSLHKDRTNPPKSNIDDMKTEVDTLPDSPTEHEFASDAFTDANINEDDLRKERELLGVQDPTQTEDKIEDDEAAWEKELQKELQEYELVGGSSQEFDDDDIESEILQQIHDETVEP